MIATIIAAIVLPLILAFLLVAADMRSDLSDLKPARPFADPTAQLMGWEELTGPHPDFPPRVRMLGYMMDGYEPSQDGAPVHMFILMPEAGQLLHPAHRIPDQMVEIWLHSQLPFRYRSLIWVSGKLSVTPQRPGHDTALYAIHDARIEPAGERDIARWFLP